MSGDRPMSSVVLHADSVTYRLTSSFAERKFRRSMTMGSTPQRVQALQSPESFPTDTLGAS